jgi:hypothetical protein
MVNKQKTWGLKSVMVGYEADTHPLAIDWHAINPFKF